MTDTMKTYIFHLRRKDGNPLFLHPFSTPAKLIQRLGSGEVIGRYGAEPRVEGLTMFRNELYRMVETGVRNWIAELRFIPRFLISTGAFLVAYFLASYVIRDPLPVIDEVAIALGTAVVVYFLLGRRYHSSGEAMKKRVEMRAAVDRISFLESGFVKRVEAALHENETHELLDVTRNIISPAAQELDDGEQEEAEHLVALLESRFNLKKLRKDERALRRFVESRNQEGESQHLRRWMELKKLDAPLYALYKTFKRTVQAKK